MSGQVKLINFFENLEELDLYPDYNLAEYSYFKAGGAAELLVLPHSPEAAADVVGICHEQSIPLQILGRGSNVLISDKGIPGVTMIFGRQMSKFIVSEDELYLEAGVRISEACAIAARHSLSGLEFACGIPGSIGGALRMNAGAYDSCFENIVTRSQYIEQDGTMGWVEGDEHQFAYRSSVFIKEGKIASQTVLQLKKSCRSEIYEQMSEYARRRRKSQPLEYPSGGSAFKRPLGYYAGKLISDAGLQGLRLGNCGVSAKHAGFIVNYGKAKAADIMAVFIRVQDEVKEKFAVDLEPEIQFIGDWSGEKMVRTGIKD